MKLSLLISLFCLFATGLFAQTSPTVTQSNVLTMIQAGLPTSSNSMVQAFFTPTTVVTLNGVSQTTTGPAVTTTWSIGDTTLSVSTLDVNGNAVWLNGGGAALATLEIANAKFAIQTATTSSTSH